MFTLLGGLNGSPLPGVRNCGIFLMQRSFPGKIVVPQKKKEKLIKIKKL